MPMTGGMGPFNLARRFEVCCHFVAVPRDSYAYLYRRLTGEQEVGLEIRSLIKTKQPKVEFHRYGRRSEAHFRRLFSVIREYLNALDSGRFNYRPGWTCSMCDFRESRCRQWAG